MIPKGVQNLETTLAACRNVLDSLGPDADSDWSETLASIVTVGQDLPIHLARDATSSRA